MLINIWSITLFVCSLVTLFFYLRALIVAVKVLRFWDHGADSAQQISLEGETHLSSALVESGLLIQTASLFLLIFAADEFSHVLAGAMCATGSFLANDYGFLALCVKLVAIFLYGFWIVFHRVDVASPYYPLTKFKHLLLFAIFPVLLADIYLQTTYLALLEPDIVTSCCGTLFAKGGKESFGLDLVYSVPIQFYGLYGFGACLLLLAGLISYRLRIGSRLYSLFLALYGFFILGYLLFALVVIVLTISSYIYSMPYHNCPFDMLKSQYYYQGYPIYLTLFGASFLGMSASLLQLFKNKQGLEAIVISYQKAAIRLSFWFLLIFLLLAVYPPLAYYFFGGERIN